MIVGLGEAARLVVENLKEDVRKIQEVRDYFEEKLKVSFIFFFFFSQWFFFNSWKVLYQCGKITVAPQKGVFSFKIVTFRRN